MDAALDELVYQDFFAKDAWAKWDAARRLMAARQMQLAATRPDFEEAFRELGKLCIEAKGLDQLLAIALIVRISELVKGRLRSASEEFLRTALIAPIDSLRTISEARKLPLEAKASEIRENIALALTHARGDWVGRYIVEALSWEDRSARCRVELFRQMAAREPNVTVWLERLTDLDWLEIATEDSGNRAARLRDLAEAMATTIRSQRNLVAVDQRTAPTLSLLMQKMVVISRTSGRSQKLTEASQAALDLLDQILVTEFTLIPEAETYAPLAIVARWWQPNPYPDRIKDGLENIARKIQSAIRWRARRGQRSDTLVARLRQALGSDEATRILSNIAETESGLDPGVEDWLRGNVREDSATADAIGAMLAGTDEVEIARSIASLLLDCLSAKEHIKRNPESILVAELRRLCSRIDAIALRLNLEVLGHFDDIVEFNSLAHRTMDGSIPSEPRVRIIRPMVARIRKDGSQDILEQAIVKEG